MSAEEFQGEKRAAPGRVLLIKSCPNDPTSRQVNHPLGLMSIAAYLREKYGYEVRIEDIRVSRNDRFGLESAVRAFNPDVVGISALTFESNAIYWIAETVKRVNASTPVLLGGPHATAYQGKALQITGIDYVVVGEGEIVAGQLIESLLNKRDISGIKGVVYKKDNQIVFNGRGDFIQDINELPMPAYDLIPIEAYGKYQRMSRTGSGVFMCLFSSRGCPYHCVYCHNIFGKVFRCRSAESFVNEIRHLYHTYNVREFEILDDIFNLDRARLLDFCDRIIQSGMKISIAFPNGLRGDLLDEQQLLKLRQAGATFIAFAVETGSPRLQKQIKKNIQLDKIKRNIEIAHSLRIHTHGFFMIGFPGETLEEMKMTVDFIFSSKLHSLGLFVVMPYEGTELGEIAREMGRVPVNDFCMGYYTKGFVNLTSVPAEKINRIRRNALLRFYLNPFRMFFFARDFPSKWELVKLVFIFFRRLRWRS